MPPPDDSESAKGEPAAIPPAPVRESQKITVEKQSGPQQPVMRGASFSAEMYSGLIPPPSLMAGWEELLPGSADRILRMAEKQTAHRISIEAKVIDGDIVRAKTGLWLGFIVALVMIAGGFVVFGLGHDWAGSSVIGTTLLGVVGSFIYGQKSRQEERKNRVKAASNQPAMPAPPG